MSLSPYLNPTNLNGALVSTNKIGGMLYPDNFDKRSKFLSGGNTFDLGIGGVGSLADMIDTVKDVSDSIANAVGTRSPMYIIGEIPRYLSDEKDSIKSDSLYIPDEVSGMVRATATIFNGNDQEGVIIDGLGKVDGTHSVEFTRNPAYYVGSNIIDQRYRVPSKLTMTIMVSNYLSDDVVGTVADSLSSLDPTGMFGSVTNMLLYKGNTRAQYALYKLRWLMENGKPFTVHTPHGIYENMLIKSLNPTTDADKMDMLYCEVEFQEMLFCKPYSSTPGNIPARRGLVSFGRSSTVDKAESMTKSGLTKINKWLG